MRSSVTRVIAAAAVLAAVAARADAQTFTWNTTTGTWNTPGNWTPAGPPTSSDATQLAFNNAGAAYTATNDIGAFTLNRLTANNTGTGLITIAGPAANTLTFAGTAPAIDVQAGGVLFTGLMAGTATVTKTGPGTFLHDSNNSGFTGQLVIDGGTFVNRATTNATTNFNPTAIVVNNGGMYQFGENTTGNPNLPNSTFITVNEGGTVTWQEGEDLGGLSLRGGLFDLQQGGFNAQGSLVSEWTAGTFTGSGSNAYNVNGAALNKTTAGTVLVTGNARLGGSQPINIQAGTLAFAVAVNLTNANPINLGDPSANTAGTLEFRGDADALRGGAVTVNSSGGTIAVTADAAALTLSDAVAGNGPLAKAGPGTLVLLAAPTNTGTTTVAGGTLRVVPGTAAGGFQVNAGATLAVSAGTGGATFSTPALNLAAADAAVRLELTTNALPTAPLLTATSLTGGGTLRLRNTQPFANGTYPLIDYSGAAITTGFTLALPGRTVGTLVYNAADTRLDANITGSDTVKWGGQTSNVWDKGTAPGAGGAANFRLASSNASTNFIDTDTVTFDDTGANSTIDIPAAVAPAAVTVNNASVAYVFGGAGRVTGNGPLTKSGTGTLTLATDNDYAGGTSVTGGVLRLGNGGTAGSVTGPITLGGGTVLAFDRSDAATVANAIAGTGGFGLRQGGTGAVTLTSPINAAGNVTSVDGPGDLTLAGALTGTADAVLNKNGAGTLALQANNNPFVGTVNVSAGTLLLDDRNGSGGDLGAAAIVVNNGGTFQFGNADQQGNPDLPGTTLLTLNAGGVAVWHIGEDYGRLNLQGGTLRINATAANTGNNNLTDTANGANQWTSGTVTNVGTATVATGVGGAGAVVKTTAGVVTFAGVNLNATGTIDIQEGAIETNANVGGSGTAGALGFGTATTAGTLRLTNADTAAVATVARPLAVNAGGGTIDITTAGKTVAFTGGVTGAGTLTKAGAGTLAASGTVAGAVNVTGGALRPGTAVAAPTLGVGGTLTFAAGTALRVNLFGPVAADNGRVNVTGAATIAAGNLVQLDLSPLTQADVDAVRAGGPRTYTVLQAAGVTGSFAGIDAANSNFGLFLSNEFALVAAPAAGTVQLSFTPVPEPAGVLAVGALGLAAVRRLRRRAATRD